MCMWRHTLYLFGIENFRMLNELYFCWAEPLFHSEPRNTSPTAGTRTRGYSTVEMNRWDWIAKSFNICRVSSVEWWLYIDELSSWWNDCQRLCITPTVLYYAHGLVLRPRFCILPTVLYYAHCFVLRPLFCIMPTVLYYVHCFYYAHCFVLRALFCISLQELEPSCGERLLQVMQTFEPRLYEASSDELKENEEEEEEEEAGSSSDKASKSSHSEEDKDSLLSDEERTKHEDSDRNSNSRGRYPGHYQGRHQQGYEGQRPGSYPYSSSSQNHQYYHHHHHQQQGYHGGGGGGHYNSRMYNMGYPPPMGPNYNPMYMGMHSPPRHPLSSVMILQRGQRSPGHFRGYHPGYGSGYHW